MQEMCWHMSSREMDHNRRPQERSCLFEVAIDQVTRNLRPKGEERFSRSWLSTTR